MNKDKLTFDNLIGELRGNEEAIFRLPGIGECKHSTEDIAYAVYEGIEKVLSVVTTAYTGKQMYFLQDGLNWYSRYSNKYMDYIDILYEIGGILEND